MASEYPYGIIKLFLCFLCGTNNGFWYTANKASYLYSEAINRKTDNTMIERKRTKGKTMIYNTPKALVARNYHPLFKTFCLHFIFNKISLFLYYFISFFLILTCSCPYSYNLMLTITYILCRPNRKLKKEGGNSLPRAPVNISLWFVFLFLFKL
jgi:hypothetical protein